MIGTNNKCSLDNVSSSSFNTFDIIHLFIQENFSKIKNKFYFENFHSNHEEIKNIVISMAPCGVGKKFCKRFISIAIWVIIIWHSWAYQEFYLYIKFLAS